MIRYVCSECGEEFLGGEAQIRFETRLSIRPVPTSSGIGIGIESTPNINLTGVDIKWLRCPHCGERVTSTPRYHVSCGSCGESLETTSDVTEAAARFCRDTHRIYCNKCWKELQSRFCEVCQYADDCTLLHINRR